MKNRLLLLVLFISIPTLHAQNRRYDEILQEVYLKQNGKFLTGTSTADGSNLFLANETNEGSHYQKFIIKFWGNAKGYSLAPTKAEWQVFCTSRSNYENNNDYLSPGFPIWLWAWMNGGNQFWKFEKIEGNKYYIKNSYSNLYLGTVKGKATQMAKKDANCIWEVDVMDKTKIYATEAKLGAIVKEGTICIMDPNGIGGYVISDALYAKIPETSDYTQNMKRNQELDIVTTNNYSSDNQNGLWFVPESIFFRDRVFPNLRQIEPGNAYNYWLYGTNSAGTENYFKMSDGTFVVERGAMTEYRNTCRLRVLKHFNSIADLNK